MKQYKAEIKEFLAENAADFRRSRELTQEEMAEMLHITPRAYGDLERGKYCFSTLSLLLLFCMLKQDELTRLMDKLRKMIFDTDDYLGEKQA